MPEPLSNEVGTKAWKLHWQPPPLPLPSIDGSEEVREGRLAKEERAERREFILLPNEGRAAGKQTEGKVRIKRQRDGGRKAGRLPSEEKTIDYWAQCAWLDITGQILEWQAVCSGVVGISGN